MSKYENNEVSDGLKERYILTTDIGNPIELNVTFGNWICSLLLFRDALREELAGSYLFLRHANPHHHLQTPCCHWFYHATCCNSKHEFPGD